MIGGLFKCDLCGGYCPSPHVCRSTQVSLSVPIDALGLINWKLDQIMKGQHDMAAVLDDLRAEVERSKTVTQSAITLIQGLAAKLDTAVKANDMSGVIAVRDELKASDDALAAAIAANTTAAVEPPAEPPATPANPEPPLA